jgi:hypothetical protein
MVSALKYHSFPTAWNMKHKCTRVMKETDDRRLLHGIILLDDV